MSMMLWTSCTATVAPYYKKCMRPTSFYRTSYCFELPQQEVRSAVAWVLQQAHFPKGKENKVEGRFVTRPTPIPHYSCNAKWSYVVGLEIQVKEYRGVLDTKVFPAWVFQKKLPPLPSPPERNRFTSFEAYDRAYQIYWQQVTARSDMVQKYVTLMKRWQGCDIQRSSLRTVVSIKAKITGYPVDFLGNVQRQKPRSIQSDKTIEYATLREIGRRLKKAQFMPRILP